ncbi:nuclear transport factor 2 family protein [Pedobacter psychrodurus]|uniref:Nuclear transport factor 2 family protein n=1 Tax=Pedobacter psychrodurus TaxID=2530456 RepID=A0A4V2MRB0_9SPHI|nr:nuclear transport factor 2 family protein [Pedobacter psychrodurus]TCD28707.1 nuclear transport factor 2 family protein [Pedobacter psychrodurus]
MEDSKKMPAAELYRKSLDRFLAKDMKGWAELCADDIVAEFPFAPAGSLTRFDGKGALYAFLKDYPGFIDVKSLPTLKIYGTDDQNVVIAEWSVSGVVISNGNPYEMSYVSFVTFRDGLIVNLREYFNPEVFKEAMGGVDFV